MSSLHPILGRAKTSTHISATRRGRKTEPGKGDQDGISAASLGFGLRPAPLLAASEVVRSTRQVPLLTLPSGTAGQDTPTPHGANCLVNRVCAQEFALG
jgi:hypothetical protein